MAEQIVSFWGEDLFQLLNVLQEDFTRYVCVPAHNVMGGTIIAIT